MNLLRRKHCLPWLWLALSAAAIGEELPDGIMHLDGRPVPALRLDNMDGEPFDLTDSRGHWVFVHFWATWCGPCRREMPTIQKMMSRLEDTDLEIVMVNTAETEDEVFSFLGIVAPDLVPLMDSDGRVTDAWQPRGLPATFLVDPEGRLRYLALGGREWHTPPYLEFLRRLSARQTIGAPATP
ncbi:MAG: TlpA disulfide reductase family protein [Gammaproteobacteria bacterium]|jgi:thiol-disulfide isomerase/thioredoxin